jgi:hypothetical protein
MVLQVIWAYSSAVEHPAHNRTVPGSIPGGPTKKRSVVRGRKSENLASDFRPLTSFGARWRSGLTHQPFTLAFTGSNPVRVTKTEVGSQKSEVGIKEIPISEFRRLTSAMGD